MDVRFPKVPIFAVALVLVTQLAVAGSGPIRRFPNGIKGEYIVALTNKTSKNAAAEAADLAARFGGTVQLVYDQAPVGFFVKMPEPLAEALSRDPRVRYVEENTVGSISDTSGGISASRDVSSAVAGGPFWHLDRISERYLPLDGYFFYCGTGLGVTAYVVDNGVQANHPEFLNTGVSRVTTGYDSFYPASQKRATNPFETCRWSSNPTVVENCGHGTAVASLLGGKTYGVAPNATIVPVAGVTEGGQVYAGQLNMALNWILSDIKDPQGQGKRPAVVNFSGYLPAAQGLEYTGDGYTNERFAALVANGLTVVTSANQYSADVPTYDSCARTPAMMAYSSTTTVLDHNGFPLPEKVISVGGSMINGSDTIWTDSASGSCVDIFAPAKDIKSAEYRSFDGSIMRIGSGTSYAAPQVAGYAALILEQYVSDPGDLRASPTSVWNSIKDNATGNPVNGSSPVLSNVTNGGHTAPNNWLLYYYGSSRCRLAGM